MSETTFSGGADDVDTRRQRAQSRLDPLERDQTAVVDLYAAVHRETSTRVAT